MTWVLLIANRARRAKRDMPRAEAEQIDAAYVEMLKDPYSGDIKFLRGTDRAVRRKVGAWRIMFDVDDDRRIIVVTDVKRRDSNTY
jgi:mRNA-degrading endonuclease RelE of RelBE toxin-antitoxin system